MAEGFWADDAYLSCVGHGAHLDALKAWGRDSGLVTMTQEGLRQVFNATTSFEDVLSISDD